MSAEHDVVEVGTDALRLEEGNGVVQPVEPPARLAKRVDKLGGDTHGEDTGLLGVLDVDVAVVGAGLVDEGEDLLATSGITVELDLDGVRAGEDHPTPGVDTNADPSTAEDLGELSEPRRELGETGRTSLMR